MQRMYGVFEGSVESLEMPAADDFVLPGIRWGKFDELYTPAYWRGQLWQHALLGTYAQLRLGRTLGEEIAACLLGGFGMRAELGIAAFNRLRECGALDSTPTAQYLEALLAEPFVIRGKYWKYRFPRQKARYLSAALRQVRYIDFSVDDIALRERLAQLPGVGLKTASWIVRNFRNSNFVAVLDVHIIRAGQKIGLFSAAETPQRHYLQLEQKFLSLANAMGVQAAMLDGLMWDYMRRFGMR